MGGTASADMRAAHEAELAGSRSPYRRRFRGVKPDAVQAASGCPCVRAISPEWPGVQFDVTDKI